MAGPADAAAALDFPARPGENHAVIPLRDSARSGSAPFLTLAIIAVNALAFFYELSLPEARLEQFFFTFGMVPARAAAVATPEVTLAGAYLPFFSSMFLHGGWMHLLGNMWFLWIFGDNVEDRLGRLWYLGFYLLCGLGAGLAHFLFNLGSSLPTIGASGAVAGVLGAYFVMFPGSRVLTLVPAFAWFTIELPAWVMLGYWFVVQFFSGTTESLVRSGETGGVAWWAHVGGFALGAAIAKLFGGAPRPRGFQVIHDEE